MLPALATVAEAAVFGIEVTDAALLRASTRIRAFVGQQITSDTSTITVRGTSVRLPERPVTAVSSVLDWNGEAVEQAATSASAAGWWLSGDVLTLPTSAEYTVEYEHGRATLSDELIEFTATLAARIAGTDPSLAAGVQSETSGSVSQSFGMDAWRGMSDLTSEEKAKLRRLFPRHPRTLVMRGY